MTALGKILIVEDDSVDRLIFEKFTKRSEFKYPYKIASGTKEAFTYLSEEKFIAIVSDYNLGDGTAFDILAKIKHIPLIIVTGIGDEKIAVKAMKNGAADYLIKEPTGGYLETIPIAIDKALAHKEQQNELFKYKKYLEEMVQERTEKLNNEISHHKDTLKILEASQKLLKNTNAELQEKNILLKGVLSQIDKEKSIVHETIALNIERNIIPMLKQLKSCIGSNQLSPCARTIDMIEKYLQEINTDYFKSLESLKIKLTPTEIKICHFIVNLHDV